MPQKTLSAWFSRASLIGDTVMFLPVLNYLNLWYPNCYTIFPISRKTSQSVPLFVNHPRIDRIHVLQEYEGMGPDDIKMAESCELKVDCFPSHPFEQDWYNYRNIYEETWIMAGIGLGGYHNLESSLQKPKLYPYFDTVRDKKSIAIWPFAGYGRDNERSPSEVWWKSAMADLVKMGYRIFHFGHFDEYNFEGDFAPQDYVNLTQWNFFDQIKASLKCGLSIGTDSGSSLIMGAYEFPQITLLTNWNVGHVKNFLALAPNSPNNISLFAENGCDNISKESVLEKVKDVI